MYTNSEYSDGDSQNGYDPDGRQNYQTVYLKPIIEDESYKNYDENNLNYYRRYNGDYSQNYDENNYSLNQQNCYEAELQNYGGDSHNYRGGTQIYRDPQNYRGCQTYRDSQIYGRNSQNYETNSDNNCPKNYNTNYMNSQKNRKNFERVQKQRFIQNFDENDNENSQNYNTDTQNITTNQQNYKTNPRFYPYYSQNYTNYVPPEDTIDTSRLVRPSTLKGRAYFVPNNGEECPIEQNYQQEENYENLNNYDTKKEISVKKVNNDTTVKMLKRTKKEEEKDSNKYLDQILKKNVTMTYRCNRCCGGITDRRKMYLTPLGTYHSYCFTCNSCDKALDVNNYYENGGEIYCDNCHFKFFA